MRQPDAHCIKVWKHQLRNVMKTKTSPWAAILTATVFVWFSSQTMAAEKAAVDPTGTWTIARIKPDTKAKIGSGQTLKLKLDAGKLTGTITGRSSDNGNVRNFEWPIKNTNLHGNEIKFAVTHAPVTGNGPDSTATYEGKITGDTMTGNVEIEFNGQTIKSEWEAKRLKL